MTRRAGVSNSRVIRIRVSVGSVTIADLLLAFAVVRILLDV